MTQSAVDRVPLDLDYVQALGRAMYIFARLEWQAVWCCEKISPNTIGPLSKRTAGGVVKALNDAVQHAPIAAQADLQSAADEFSNLLVLRNSLAHGRPCTAPDGEQRLSRDGEILTHDYMKDAAERFAQCGAKLNSIFLRAFEK